MARIYLQLVTASGFVSWAIRQLTRSRFSHVDVCLPSGSLLGAHADGIKVRPPDYEKFTSIQKYYVDVPPEIYSKFYQVLYAQLNKPYDYTAIFGILFNRNWREDDSFYCSELVAWVFEQIDYPLLNPGVEVNRITPRDLELSPYLKLA